MKMSKKMYEISEKMQELHKEAEAFQNSGDTEKTLEKLSEFDELKKQVAIFKRDILAQLESQTKLVSEMPDWVIPEPEVAAAEAEIPVTIETVEEETLECNDIERIISEMRTAEEQPITLGEPEDETQTDAIDASDEQDEIPEVDTNERKAPNFKVNIDFDEDETEGEDDSDEVEDDVNTNSETERIQYTFDGDVSEISE